jgi:hypothetical protein
MNKLAIFLISLTILAMASIFTYIFIQENYFSGDALPALDPILEKDLGPSMENINAVRIALNDHGVKEQLQGHAFNNSSYDKNTYWVEYVWNVSLNDTDFIGLKGRYTYVNFVITGNDGEYANGYTLITLVDVSKKRVIEQIKMRHNSSTMDIEVNLPPRVSWFTRIYKPTVTIEHAPRDAPLHLYEVDQTNLDKLLKGQDYKASLYDGSTGQWSDAISKIQSNASDQVQLQGNMSLKSYTSVDNPVNIYLILKNSDKEQDIKVNMEL